MNSIHQPRLRTYFIGLFFALCTMAFLIFYMTAKGIRDVEEERRGDWYLGLAFNLIEHGIYIDCLQPPEGIGCGQPLDLRAYRLPGYPIYLTGNMLLFGRHDPIAAIHLLNAALVGSLVFMASVLAARITGSDLSAGLTGLVMLITHQYNWSYVLYTELWFAFLLMLFTILASVMQRRRTAFIVGILLGVCLLTRGSLLFALPLLLFVLPKHLVISLAIGALLVVALWTLRNTLVLNAFVPFSTGSGAVLWGANNPVTYGIEPPGAPSGDWINTPDLPYWDTFRTMGEVEQDRALSRYALDFIGTVSPDRILQAAFAKILNLFGLTAVSYSPTGFIMFAVTMVCVFVMSVFKPIIRENIRQLWRQRIIGIMIAVIFATILNSIVFYGSNRFRYPIDPYIAMFTGIGLTLLLLRRRLFVARLIAQQASCPV